MIIINTCKFPIWPNVNEIIVSIATCPCSLKGITNSLNVLFNEVVPISPKN
jgi:hypothetical protein